MIDSKSVENREHDGVALNLAAPPTHARSGSVAVTGRLTGTMGLVASICGVLLVATDGLGMDRTELANSPFSTFLVPGLILFIVVGGSHLVASYLCAVDHLLAPAGAIAAGTILVGWIGIEAIMISSGRLLQGAIFTYAFAEIVLGVSAWWKSHDRHVPYPNE